MTEHTSRNQDETLPVYAERTDQCGIKVGGTMPREFAKTSVRFLEESFHWNVSTAHALTRAALPHLLRALDDKTPTRLTINGEDFIGGMPFAREMDSNPVHATEWRVLRGWRHATVSDLSGRRWRNRPFTISD